MNPEPFQPPVTTWPDEPSSRFLPYPTSTLSPKITALDLSDFKSRGATQVEREIFQKLELLRAEYLRLVDQFNWNKLIYESRFSFEPVVGQAYHLYRSGPGFALSMIEPHQWNLPFVGTFLLRDGGQWHPRELSPDFDLHAYVASQLDTD